MTSYTLGELIHSLDREVVFAELAKLYQGGGESPEGYREVWDCLHALQPQTTDLSVCLSRRWSCDKPPEALVDVSGIKEGDDPQHLAIEFVDWREWLSMPIAVSAELAPMSAAEQVAHCLYEMTWAGYTQRDIKDMIDGINNMVDEIETTFSESCPTEH